MVEYVRDKISLWGGTLTRNEENNWNFWKLHFFFIDAFNTAIIQYYSRDNKRDEVQVLAKLDRVYISYSLLKIDKIQGYYNKGDCALSDHLLIEIKF